MIVNLCHAAEISPHPVTFLLEIHSLDTHRVWVRIALPAPKRRPVDQMVKAATSTIYYRGNAVVSPESFAVWLREEQARKHARTYVDRLYSVGDPPRFMPAGGWRRITPPAKG